MAGIFKKSLAQALMGVNSSVKMQKVRMDKPVLTLPSNIILSHPVLTLTQTLVNCFSFPLPCSVYAREPQNQPQMTFQVKWAPEGKIPVLATSLQWNVWTDLLDGKGRTTDASSSLRFR